MYTYSAIVDRVVDADTLDLNIDLGFDVWVKQRVRLAGVDAPERFTDEGKAATAWVVDVVAKAETIEVRTEKLKKGKYGRYIAYLVVGGEDLSEALVKAGHAVYRDY